jgi:demethylmenaquinone methyltransferase/2-methoxy-6-polyprenyl-1,4-benzoquinol methylase
MFAEVAPRYDFLNHTLSGGIDALWRKKTVAKALEGRSTSSQPVRVLDVCSGTGDLAFSFARAGCRVFGGDFCVEMLDRGERKRGMRAYGDRLRFFAADAQHLPFVSDSFDCATVAFGIRNVQDPVQGLRDMARVVRPGGKVLVLEFSKPRTPVLGPLYLWYFRNILPKIGALLSPRSRASNAYDYLPESVMHFPEREAFVALMEEAGLEKAQFKLLSFGIACLYWGFVPEA